MFSKKKVSNFLIVTLIVLLTVGATAEAATLGSRPILMGARGQDVQELQMFLNEKGYREGHIDGVFGPLTSASLMRFQAENGLPANGLADKETINLIKEMIGKATEASAAAAAADEFNFTAVELDLFARIVYAEASGEGFAGQVAVAASILNRIRSELFPDTLSAVVFQVVGGSYQYSPVLDGRINLPAGESVKRAIAEALSGTDPTGGATGFYNPAKTSNQWVRSRPVTVTIGNHVFFK
ncbi:MAG: cell wall hydrolase [Dethiobacter sp.]|jgi:N-acetylmuramoyl-L-alanine amidase|nr:cell wall hydrolase [Dethiobacter sp.]MBS3902427.1 cell wall hydrolase [Dethiobacter sp.]MBS3989575.1 cell wall hydrolase [Dethiobacter sp.]